MQFNKVIVGLSLLVITTMASAVENDKTVYGRYEHVKLIDLKGLELPAKLDTGAWTASLSATNIQLFEKEGKQWVRFNPLVQGKTLDLVEKPVVRISKIKRRAADVTKPQSNDKTTLYTPRPEIEMQICMGNQQETVKVNLTDRSGFEYPFLLGASTLKKFHAIVDPSLKYESKATCTAKTSSISE